MIDEENYLKITHVNSEKESGERLLIEALNNYDWNTEIKLKFGLMYSPTEKCCGHTLFARTIKIDQECITDSVIKLVFNHIEAAEKHNCLSMEFYLYKILPGLVRYGLYGVYK